MNINPKEKETLDAKDESERAILKLVANVVFKADYFETSRLMKL
jgi:hypothetical protein